MVYFRQGIHFPHRLPTDSVNSRDSLKLDCKRVVVKIGSKALASSDGKPDLAALREFCGQVSDLHDKGLEVCIVTSGAILCGRAKLGLNGFGKTLQAQQASAAVGQALLMDHYNSFFGERGKSAAQILLTDGDFSDSDRRASLASAFECLLKLNAIPIVNENDVVSTSELDLSEGKDERLFSDNDVLSSLVAKEIKADLLVILSTVDGLLDGNGRVIENVCEFCGELDALDNGVVDGRGGIATKLKAFKQASEAGIAGVLANASEPRVLDRILAGEAICTFFPKASSAATNADFVGRARLAQKRLGQANAGERTAALEKVAESVLESAGEILAANRKDVGAAERKGVARAFLDRLKLDQRKLQAMADSMRSLAALPESPAELAEWTRPNGLRIRKIRVPLGVILLVFESRPDVVIEAAGLAIKSGNAIILKGGSEAQRTNSAIANAVSRGLERAGFSGDCVQLHSGDRRELRLLLQEGSVDLVVPRGGEGLLGFIAENSKSPVLFAGGGVCHVYVHEDANLDNAVKIICNAKVQKPSACNALEALLVNEAVAEKLLPGLAVALREKGVELRCCERSFEILEGKGVKRAAESDWGKEFSSLILAMRVVKSMDEALSHISKYGTKHSEAILTESREAYGEFAGKVDAAVVYWNASTRFTDGGEFGFGAELCISTQKLHARGPVGIEGLYTYKYVVEGNGQIRGD